MRSSRARASSHRPIALRGDTFRLKDIDPEDTAGLEAEDKPRAQEGLRAGVGARRTEDRLYAQDRWAVLLIFQAMDGGQG